MFPKYHFREKGQVDGGHTNKITKPKYKAFLREIKYQVQYREVDYSRSLIFICLAFTCLLICLPVTRSYYVAEAGLELTTKTRLSQTFF